MDNKLKRILTASKKQAKHRWQPYKRNKLSLSDKPLFSNRQYVGPYLYTLYGDVRFGVFEVDYKAKMFRWIIRPRGVKLSDIRRIS